MSTDDVTALMFMVLSGVLQGCPLSGSLFAIGIDASLHICRICQECFHLAWIRTCAVDVGMAMSKLRHLPLVQVLCSDFKSAAGFASKAIKRIVI